MTSLWIHHLTRWSYGLTPNMRKAIIWKLWISLPTGMRHLASTILRTLGFCFHFATEGVSYINSDKYSLLMHRIKIKSPANFLWNEQNVFVGGFITFQSVLLWRYYNDKKAYRILAVLPFKMSDTSLSRGLPWSLVSTPWAMSLYFKFRAIYFWLLNEYSWWDQAKIYHIIRQLSYRFMCEIITWSDDKTNLIHKNISTRLRLRALKP